MNELEELKSKIEELEKENNKLERNSSYWQDKAEKLEGKFYNEDVEITQITVTPETSFSALAIYGLSKCSKIYRWDEVSVKWRLFEVNKLKTK